PRYADIGEHCAWTTEDVILQYDTFVYGNVVLDFAAIAHLCAWADHDILADDTIAPDHTPLEDMRKMPDAGPGTDLCSGIDDGAGVQKKIVICHPVSPRH